MEYTENIKGNLNSKGVGMLKKLRLGATVIVALFGVVLFGDTAFASSIYDENYTTTSSVHLGNTASPGSGGACEAVDYTNDWANAMTTTLTNGENSNNSAAAAYLASWQEAQQNGRWGVSQGYFRFNPSDLTQRTYDYIMVYWTEDSSLGLSWTWVPDTVVTTGNSVKVVILHTEAAWVYGSSACNPYAVLSGGSGNPAWVSTEADGNGDGYYIANNLFVYSDHLNLPTGYEGEQISVPDFSSDYDEDDLAEGYENAQGTSDASEDTDGDGIDDLKESLWYPNRNDVFCGSQCAYPDPLVKDVYVEVDWMDSGTTEYKPTSTQLGLVEDSLDERGYNVHIDTGQYGGGEELSDYIEYLSFTFGASPVGFFDLKNGNVGESIPANFSSNRQGIWRYLISGYGVGENHSLSGGSYAGSDNILIATGYIYDHPGFGYNDIDVAIAGTIVHELGHSLCMSRLQRYSFQSTDCRYSGVDTEAVSTYDSVLNYNLQMFQTNLSNGSNVMGDHDDWGAIDSGGIADFSQWNTGEADFEPGTSLKKSKPTKSVMKKGISLEQAQAAKRNGTLGIVTRNGKTYDLKKKNGSSLPLVLNNRD